MNDTVNEFLFYNEFRHSSEDSNTHNNTSIESEKKRGISPIKS